MCELEELLDERVTCIVDFQGTGWANADLDLLFFSLNFLSRYTPRILRRILIVDMPWIFRAAYKTIQRFLPEDQRNFLQLITREQLLQEVIDPANAPDFLGGTCSIPYSGWTRSHPHSSSWIDFGFTNFSEYTLKRAHRFAKLFIPFFLDDKFRSDYYVLLIEMLERALKLYGSKATCQDVIDRYPRIKELQSFERLEYMCRVLDAAGEIPDDSIGSLLATEAKPVPAQSDSGEPDDKSAPANQSDPVSTRIQPSDRKIAKETTLKAADSIAVS